MLKLDKIQEKDYTECKYYNVIDNSYNGLTRVISEENDKYGYIDNAGNLVIPCIYKSATNFGDGYAVVIDDDRNAKIINTKGEVITLLDSGINYSLLKRFHNGLFVAQSKIFINNGNGYTTIEKFNYINVKGEKLLPNDVDYASDFSDGFALIYREGIPIIIDTNGKPHPELLEEYQKIKETKINLTIDEAGFKNGLLKIITYSNQTYGYIYKDGRVFRENEDLNSLYNLTTPQCLVVKSIDPNCDLLNKYYSEITYFGKKVILCADTKEELVEKKKAFYQELKDSLNNYITTEIDSKIADEQATRKL